MSIIDIKNLTFAYEGSYDNVFENVSFRIDTDWKLGLIGRNGKGKTTFLRLLQGKYEYKGIISKNVDVDYFPFEVKNKELDFALIEYRKVLELSPDYVWAYFNIAQIYWELERIDDFAATR